MAKQLDRDLESEAAAEKRVFDRAMTFLEMIDDQYPGKEGNKPTEAEMLHCACILSAGMCASDVRHRNDEPEYPY